MLIVCRIYTHLTASRWFWHDKSEKHTDRLYVAALSSQRAAAETRRFLTIRQSSRGLLRF